MLLITSISKIKHSLISVSQLSRQWAEGQPQLHLVWKDEAAEGKASRDAGLPEGWDTDVLHLWDKWLKSRGTCSRHTKQHIQQGPQVVGVNQKC